MIFLKLFLILDGLILLRKGDFCCEGHHCDGFGGGILSGAQDMEQFLLKRCDCTVR